SLQRSQHKSTGWPSTITFTGGRIEPRRLSVMGHIRCASARFRSAAVSLSRLALISASSLGGVAEFILFSSGATAGASLSLEPLGAAYFSFRAFTLASVSCGLSSAFCLQPLQHRKTG